jgi:hypothetical protein
MNFHCAVETINKLLIEKRPDAFNSSWVRKHSPSVYRFIQKNIRADVGGIDWDRITRAIDLRFQRNWRPSYRNRTKIYRGKAEVGIVFQKYHDKLYVFIAPKDKDDEYKSDSISIALVRIAQRGNVLAKEEISRLVRFTIDEWIESSPSLSS